MTEQLEEEFAREIMRSERTRMAILAALLAGLVAGFVAMFLLFHRQYLEVFRTREPLEAIVGVMALLMEVGSVPSAMAEAALTRAACVAAAPVPDTPDG